MDASLRRRARTFGQTGTEHARVHQILKDLNVMVSETHKDLEPNSAGGVDREILIEIAKLNDSAVHMVIFDKTDYIYFIL